LALSRLMLSELTVWIEVSAAVAGRAESKPRQRMNFFISSGEVMWFVCNVCSPSIRVKT